MGQLKHIKEFDYYYGLGASRSYTKVAEKFKKSIKTIEKWGYTEGWQKEVRLRDKLVLEKARERAVIDKVETIEDYRKIIKASLSVYIDKLKKGKIDIKTVQDMERLMKLDIDLLNEVEEAGLKGQPQGVSDQPQGVNENTKDNNKLEVEITIVEAGGDYEN